MKIVFTFTFCTLMFLSYLNVSYAAEAVDDAQVEEPDSWSFTAGLDFGGDKLLKVIYTSGEASDIYAGEGMYLKLGRIFPLTSAGDLDLVGSLGWKFTGIIGTNGNATLRRFPLDLALRYTAIDKHRFAVGATKDLAINYSGSGVLSGVGLNMRSKVGYAAQYEYLIGKGRGVGVRYTSLEYEATDYNALLDASSWGIFLGLDF